MKAKDVLCHTKQVCTSDERKEKWCEAPLTFPRIYDTDSKSASLKHQNSDQNLLPFPVLYALLQW